MDKEMDYLAPRHRIVRSMSVGGSIHLPEATLKNANLDRKLNRSAQDIDTEAGGMVKTHYTDKLNIQHYLKHLKKDMRSVTYLDGASRGLPQGQWDTRKEEWKKRATEQFNNNRRGSAVLDSVLRNQDLLRGDSVDENPDNNGDVPIIKVTEYGSKESLDSSQGDTQVESNLIKRFSRSMEDIISDPYQRNRQRIDTPYPSVDVSGNRSEASLPKLLPKRENMVTTQYVPQHKRKRRKSQSLTDLRHLHKELPIIQPGPNRNAARQFTPDPLTSKMIQDVQLETKRRVASLSKVK